MEKDHSDIRLTKRSRRNFIRTAGATGATLPFVIGSASANEGVEALATSEPSAQGFLMEMGRSRPVARSSSLYGADAIGRGQIQLFRRGGTDFGSTTLSIPIEQQTSVINYTGNDRKINNLSTSIVDVRANSSEPGYLSDESARQRNTGGYTGKFVDPDDYTFAEAVLTTAHDEFRDWLIGKTPIASDIYDGAKLVDEIWSKWSNDSATQQLVTREWDFANESTASQWSKYHAVVDKNEVLDLQFDLMQGFLGQYAIFTSVSMALWGAKLGDNSITDLTAEEARKRGIKVYDAEEVRKDPAKFHVSETFLADHDGDYVYKRPVNAKITDISTTPSDAFVRRHEDEIRRFAPEYLEERRTKSRSR